MWNTKYHIAFVKLTAQSYCSATCEETGRRGRGQTEVRNDFYANRDILPKFIIRYHTIKKKVGGHLKFGCIFLKKYKALCYSQLAEGRLTWTQLACPIWRSSNMFWRGILKEAVSVTGSNRCGLTGEFNLQVSAQCWFWFLTDTSAFIANPNPPQKKGKGIERTLSIDTSEACFISSLNTDNACL